MRIANRLVLKTLIALSTAAIMAGCGDNTSGADNLSTQTKDDTGFITAAEIKASFGPETVFEDEFTKNTGFLEDGSINATSSEAVWCTRLPWAGGGAIGGPLARRDACTFWEGLDYLGRNNEVQRYGEGAFPLVGTTDEVAMHELLDDPDDVGDKFLRLGAVKVQDIQGKTKWSHRSGMIRSAVVFKPDEHTSYFVRARVRVPSAGGTWPTFWLVPSTYEGRRRAVTPPELDILEPFNEVTSGNSEPIAANACLDGGGTNGDLLTGPTGPAYMHGQGAGSTMEAVQIDCDLRHGWLETSMLWTHQYACYLHGANGENTDPRTPGGSNPLEDVPASELGLEGVTGTLRCQPYTWDSNSATLILNLAIGGKLGGDASSLTTSQFDVDWVKVHRKCANEATGPTGDDLSADGFQGVANDGSTQWRIKNCGPTPGALTISTPDDQTSTAGDTVSLQITATGGTGSYLFNATTLPGWLTITAGGLVTGQAPIVSSETTETVSVTVTDDIGADASTSFTWTVVPEGGGGGGGGGNGKPCNPKKPGCNP